MEGEADHVRRASPGGAGPTAPAGPASPGPPARAGATGPAGKDRRARFRQLPAPGPAPETIAEVRSVPARLARLHLKGGSVALARAELELLARTESLDTEGLLDLAEARWRTGELIAAGEVAEGYLSAGGQAVLALVIAAEAAAEAGRLAQASELAARAIARADLHLDRAFAGLPRSEAWSGVISPGPETATIGSPARRGLPVATEPSRPPGPPVPQSEQPAGGPAPPETASDPSPVVAEPSGADEGSATPIFSPPEEIPALRSLSPALPSPERSTPSEERP